MPDPLLEQKKTMYINSLLNETLPQSMVNDALMDEIGVSKDHDFGVIHILFSNEMLRKIESKDSDNVADWKSSIHDLFLNRFQAPFILFSCILNLAPYTRTIVYSFHPESLQKLKSHIRQWFDTTNASLKSSEDAGFMAFANPKAMAFNNIGRLYKELRQLQEYRFIIGMDHLSFYDEFSFNSDYTVEEYKYIQRYEALLKDGRYDNLHDLHQELTDFLRNNRTKDAKVIYIYKELMSITIRHLYSNETDNLALIEQLNQSINNFDTAFNDLWEVADYINTLLYKLADAQATNEQHHPHIRRALRAVRTGYGTDLTLESLADSLDLSDAYLSRLFKEHMHITFKQYLTRYRLDKIKDLLVNTNKSITEIASLTGYQSANQMTRIFKKYEKMTPREYRQHS